MAKSGVLTVRLVSDTKDLEAGLARAGQQVDSTGDKFANAGKKMTLFATVPIVAGMAAATNAASNLEQSMGAVESIFGDAVGPVLKFGEQAAETAGLSKREVNEMAAVLGASLQGMGFEADESATKVVELQKRGADMAATFGGTTKDALDAIASLMRGERDPIEKYGVSIKAVDVNARILALGLDTSTAATKKNAEAVAGLDLLMEQTAKTQGQFARESDSTAGAQQRAKAAFENSAASLGEKLLPIAASAADKVAFLAEKFGEMPAPVQNAILAIGGVVALAGPVLTVAGNVAKMADAIKKVNAASLVTKGGIIGLGVALAGLTVHAVASAEGFEEKIVKGFAKVTDVATGDLVDAFDQVGGSLEIFTGLAEANLTQAVRLRDGLRELGRDTSDLDAIIDKHVETQRKVKTDTEAAALAISGEGEASVASADQVDTLTDSLNDLLTATLAQFDAGLKYESQVNSTADAIGEYHTATAAVMEAKGKDTKANEALERSTIDAAQAVLGQAAAASKAAEQQATLAGKTLSASEKAAIQKAELEKVRDTLAPGSPLRLRLDEYISKLASIPATVSTTIEQNFVSRGSPGQRPIVRRALGGPLAAGQVSLVGEDGPEVFVPRSAGTVIPNAGQGRPVGVGTTGVVKNFTLIANYPVGDLSAQFRKLEALGR